MKILVSEKISPHKYKTPEGYLVCVDSILSRTGKQEYRKNEVFVDSDDDSIVEVDRTEKEVFSPQALASFENKPITIEHPDVDVTTDNHKDLSVGFVRDIKKGEFEGEPVMLGTLVITDSDAIRMVEEGELEELSCGYDCDIQDEENPQQRNIRGNHVALCERGRAGIARIVDSVKDAKLPSALKKNIQRVLAARSTFTKRDIDVSDIVKEIERYCKIDGTPCTLTRKSIKGWFKSGDGMMRKDYIFSVDGYDNHILISLYADPDTWKVTEANGYFVDSVKDAEFHRYSVAELKNFKPGTIITIQGKEYTKTDNTDIPWKDKYGNKYSSTYLANYKLTDDEGEIEMKDAKEYRIVVNGIQRAKWEANSAEEAVKEFLEANPAYANSKKGKVEARDCSLIADDEDLLTKAINDEVATIELYNTMLDGGLDDETREIIEEIRDDENDHLVKLTKIKNGTVDKQDLVEDEHIKDDLGQVEKVLEAVNSGPYRRKKTTIYAITNTSAPSEDFVRKFYKRDNLRLDASAVSFVRTGDPLYYKWPYIPAYGQADIANRQKVLAFYGMPKTRVVKEGSDYWLHLDPSKLNTVKANIAKLEKSLKDSVKDSKEDKLFDILDKARIRFEDITDKHNGTIIITMEQDIRNMQSAIGRVITLLSKNGIKAKASWNYDDQIEVVASTIKDSKKKLSKKDAIDIIRKINKTKGK